MEKSPRLSLPYLAPQQAQKHVTVNENLRRLDALVQLCALSRTTTTEPANPAEGDAYILGAARAGATWSGMTENAIAAFQDGAWTEISPRVGWRAFVADEAALVVFNAAQWTVVSGGAGSETAQKFGVNTTATSAQRLAVKSDSVWLSHDDVAPGTGDVRIIVNKAASANTASHVFQKADSGRAEIGLAGDDDFRLKVSANGTAWSTAMVVSKDDGSVGIGGAPFARLSVQGSNMSDPQVGDVHIRKDGWYAFLFLDCFGAVGSPFSIQRRARGTQAAPAAVQAADSLGGFSFRGFAPSGAFVQTALVSAVVDGSPSGGSVPTALLLCAGSTGAAERMRITSAGDVGIGVAAPACRLDIDGPVRVKTYMKTALPSAAAAGQLIYVPDDAGGAVIAFSDGASWRRLTDRAPIA